MAPRKIVGIGELLWDLLPTGKQLGGAPANFAYISNLFGNEGIVASRLGTDPLGDEAARKLAHLGLDTRFIQRDPIHSTGTVAVELDPAGQPKFEIREGVAWDFLELTSSWQQLAAETDAACFGSLAQRSQASRSTIARFLRELPARALRVFDVNLRQNFYSQEVITESLAHADVLKVNDEELPILMRLFALDHRDEIASARRLLEAHELKLVCITRGRRGSVLLDQTEVDERPGCPVTVVDTVGAGDAFTAGMIFEYLRGSKLSKINETANAVGAWVASQAGAMPIAPAQGVLTACRIK